MTVTTNFLAKLVVISYLALLHFTTASAQPKFPACEGAGCVILYRHALAPGGGDPPGFNLNDCASQRNLSDEGRMQARQMGLQLSKAGIQVGAVWHSQWCRTRETAQLMLQSYSHNSKPPVALPALVPQPAFNSFFSQREQSDAQTAQARKLLQSWRGSGTLVVVTHQVNITALTGVFPQSGEGVALKIQGSEMKLLGQIAPP